MTVNKSMIELGNSLDGTIKNAVDSVKKLEGIPKAYQKFMVSGDFVWGNGQKVDISSYGNSLKELNNYIAQVSTLNKEQQKVVFSMTNFSDGQKEIITNTLNEISTGEKLNGIIAEQVLREKGFGEAAVKGLTSIYKLSDGAGNYGVALTSKVIPAMEGWINKHTELVDVNELLKNNIITGTAGNYKFSDSFIQLISNEQNAVVVTKTLTATQKAWNIATQFSKQLLLSLGVAAVAFIATKIVDYLMNLKTRSEELVATMNDSHDKAQQATKDVEEIQSKIDELNKSLKDAGVKQISDIVDPAERERLQTINDMLQAQLELKKQLEKDAINKANTDTSAAVNDITEDSIVKSHTVNVSYAEGGANAGTHQVAEKVTKTESLNEHSDYLDQLVQKRREMAAAGEEETQAYKDNEAEIEKEKKKVGELSNAVSEQADKYETDADNFDQYKDEYVGCTDAIKAAAAAIKNANDGLDVDTTNLDVLKKKIQDIQEQIANGDGKAKGTNRNDYGYLNAVDTLKSSGVTTGEDILNLASNRSSQTDEQSKAIATLRKEAKDAKVSLAEYVSVLEQTGEVSTKAASKTRRLSEAMTLLDNMQSGYQTCAAAVDEYNKKGYVTMDTLQSLINLEPQYMSMLEMKNGKLKINGKTAQTLTDVYIELARAELLTDTITKIKETNSLEKAQSVLAEVKSVLGDAEKQFMAAQHESAVKAYETDGIAGYDAVMRAAKQEWDNYKLQDELLKKLGSRKPSDIWGKDSTSKSTKQATSAIDAWSTLSSAMDEYNKKGSVSLNTMKSLMGLESKYTAFLKKEGNQLTINATEYRNLIQQELAAAAATEDTSDATKAKIAQYVKILQYLDENAKDGTISLNELRDAIEGVGASLDKTQEKTSGLKSAFGTIHDILNTDNPAGALTSDNVESVIDLIQEHSELKDILYDESGNLQINEVALKKATIALLENEKAATKDVAIQAILQKSIDDLSNGIISITDFLKGLNTELDDIDAKLDKFQGGFNDINDIVEEYNKYGKLTQDSYQKLLRLDPQYLECLKKEGDQLKFNAAQYRMLYAEQLNQLAATAKTKTQRDTYTAMLADIFGFTPEQVDEYKNAISGYQDVVQELTDQGVDHYGNVSNINRDKIDWTAENMDKYHEFVNEQNEEYPNSIVEGGYSTILGASKNIDGLEIAYTPMLQTENGLIPLTEDQLWEYLDKVIDGAYESDGGYNAENLLKIDASGFEQEINGETVKVHGMIAAVQGQIVNGAKLTGADVAAIAGATEEELQEGFGETSNFVGKDMHTLQAKVTEARNSTSDLTSILEDMGITGSKAAQLLEEHFGDADKAANDFKTTLSNISTLLSSFLGIFEKLNDTKSNDLKLWGEAMTEEIDKRIDALNEENDAQERAIELAKLQDEYERAKANKTVHVYGGKGQGFVWKADENAVREAGQNLSDKQREYKKQDELDRLNKLKEKYSEVTNLIGTDLDDYNKKLQYAAEIHNMTFDEMSAKVGDYKDKVVASLGAVKTVTDIQDTISNISNLISTLETLSNVVSYFYNGSTDGGGISGLFRNLKNMFTGESGDFDLGGGFKKMFDGAAKVVSDGWNWITGKNRAGSAALKSDTTATLDILGNTIKVNTGDIQRVSGGFFERLVGAAKDNLGSIGKFFSGA
nr:MAG TPA: hypothetical protein [Caudoviricetes sp.]